MSKLSILPRRVTNEATLLINLIRGFAAIRPTYDSGAHIRITAVKGQNTATIQIKKSRYNIPPDFHRGIPSLTIFIMTCCGIACATTQMCFWIEIYLNYSLETIAFSTLRKKQKSFGTLINPRVAFYGQGYYSRT